MLIHDSETKEEYEKLVEYIFKKYLDYGLAINLEKSEFHQKEVNFLRHIING